MAAARDDRGRPDHGHESGRSRELRVINEGEGRDADGGQTSETEEVAEKPPGSKPMREQRDCSAGRELPGARERDEERLIR